jgi:hypothetical protein
MDNVAVIVPFRGRGNSQGSSSLVRLTYLVSQAEKREGRGYARNIRAPSAIAEKRKPIGGVTPDPIAEMVDVCKRPAFPELRALKDLADDEEMATAVIRITDSFFYLNDKYTVYSGYARVTDAKDSARACLYAQVWVDDRLRRSVAFRNVGYVGILHIDISNDLGFQLGIGRDLIGIAYEKSGENPEKVLAIVAGNRSEVSYEIRR